MKMSSAGGFDKVWDQSATQRWYDEVKVYNYDNPSASKGVVGHFTQVVWKSSKTLGCGYATNGKYAYVCCRYSPPGNYIGQEKANVPRPV